MSGTAHVIPFRSKADAFDLEVTLDDVKPRIWRRLRVAASLSLRDLHHVVLPVNVLELAAIAGSVDDPLVDLQQRADSGDAQRSTIWDRSDRWRQWAF